MKRKDITQGEHYAHNESQKYGSPDRVVVVDAGEWSRDQYSSSHWNRQGAEYTLASGDVVTSSDAIKVTEQKRRAGYKPSHVWVRFLKNDGSQYTEADASRSGFAYNRYARQPLQLVSLAHLRDTWASYEEKHDAEEAAKRRARTEKQARLDERASILREAQAEVSKYLDGDSPIPALRVNAPIEIHGDLSGISNERVTLDWFDLDRLLAKAFDKGYAMSYAEGQRSVTEMM